MHRTRNIMHKSPIPYFQFQSVGEWSARKGSDFAAHKHTFWEFVYYRTGSISASIANDWFDVSPRMLLITPPQTLHSEVARTAYSNYFIGIDAPADFPWPRFCFDTADREFEKVCAAIVTEWRAARPHREAMLSLLLNQLTILIQRNADQVSPGEALVRKVEQIIAKRFAERPLIEEIAREAGASVSSLRAHFLRLRKRSPLKHLQAIRVEHSLTLLRTSNLTLDVIAEMCGYHSASHLSRHVKQVTSRSPGEVRELGVRVQFLAR